VNAGQYEGLTRRLDAILAKMPGPAPQTASLPQEASAAAFDPEDQAGKHAASRALYTLLIVLDSWIEGAHGNHEGSGHRGELRGDKCWTQFHPQDIRLMINDAARELGLSEFPRPAEGQAKEDQYR